MTHHRVGVLQALLLQHGLYLFSRLAELSLHQLLAAQFKVDVLVREYFLLMLNLPLVEEFLFHSNLTWLIRIGDLSGLFLGGDRIDSVLSLVHELLGRTLGVAFIDTVIIDTWLWRGLDHDSIP